jgi:hypothetical protein
VFESAADEIQNWISRSLLSENEADREPLQVPHAFACAAFLQAIPQSVEIAGSY